MRDRDITEVAQQSGVAASTLRSYEEKGLIASVGRRGLRRMFGPDGRPRIDRQALADRAKELDRRIRRLSAMRDGLQHAAACPAPSHMQNPIFRRLLAVAACGAIGRRSRKTPPRNAGSRARETT